MAGICGLFGLLSDFREPSFCGPCFIADEWSSFFLTTEYFTLNKILRPRNNAMGIRKSIQISYDLKSLIRITLLRIFNGIIKSFILLLGQVRLVKIIRALQG